MKKVVLLCFSVFVMNLVFAQEQAIKATHKTSGKEIILKERKRIRIKTMDGQKLTGRFSLGENQKILINDRSHYLSEITEISRSPLMLAVFTTGVLIYGGGLTAGMGAIIGAFINPAGFLLIIPGAAMIYTGIKSPNFSRKIKNDGSWSFEIITL